MVFDPSNSLNFENKMKKIFFILSDGDVETKNQQEVAKLMQKEEDICLHTFGIGPGCNEKMIKDMAAAGGGFWSIIDEIDDRI